MRLVLAVFLSVPSQSNGLLRDLQTITVMNSQLVHLVFTNWWVNVHALVLTPFVANIEHHEAQGSAFEKSSVLGNPVAVFMDNLKDPFGRVSFNANPALK